MRLPDPDRSYAVLIGVASTKAADLPELPAVHNNLTGLYEALTDPGLGGMRPERCLMLKDPVDVREVYRKLRRFSAEAEDTLLFYYAGHGLTGDVHNELYLTLAHTQLDEVPVSALGFDLVRRIFAASPAANRAVILDCCFSGRAIHEMAAPGESLIGKASIEGSYTLASAPANSVSLAPAGARYTAFTGEFLRVLREGIPDGPALLTFGMMYRQLLHTMTQQGFPLPQQRGTGTVDQLAISANRAHPANRRDAGRSTAYPLPRRQGGADVLTELDLDLRETAFGVDAPVTYTAQEKCPVCAGSGSRPGGKTVPCGKCAGRGLTGSGGACPSCGGFGDLITLPCVSCSGEGRVSGRRDITVRIPGGIQNGMRIRLGGYGDAGRFGGDSGDLYIQVNERPHDVYSRREDDLHCRVTLPVSAAILGTRITIRTLDGEETVEVQPGTEHASTIRLRGKGTRHLREEGRGDLFAHLDVRMPQDLSPEQKRLIRRFAEERGESVAEPG